MSKRPASTAPDLARLGGQFQIAGQFREAAPYGSGHINDTYCAVYDQGGTAVRYLHQRINEQVFREPERLMANVQRVTAHLRDKLAAAGLDQLTRRTLTLIPAQTGAAFHRDAAGSYWRTYIFIEHARTYDAVETADQAFQAARAFGRFQQLLVDLPGPRLHDTIPDFHHTPRRFAALERALAADSQNRAHTAQPEIAFALRRQALTGVLVDLQQRGELPERITHNDTKLNNVMLDDATGEGLCVIDLDTVMPGLALYDFGDQVRTTTSRAREDERDLAQVGLQLPLFAALVRGYLAAAGEFLTPTERQHLVFAGKLITFEIGVRFLTDHLNGDSYFKVQRPAHNLDRCRTQFRLVESVEQQEAAMTRLVEQA